jgi:DME family drug/metabolite transporter
MVGAGLCMAVYNLAFFAGIRDTGVAIGTAVALGSGPVWAGLLQALFTRQVPSGRWWLGTGLAIAGGALLCGLLTAGAMHASAIGIALCLTAGLAYAGYTLFSKRLARTTPTAVATRGAFIVAALVAVPCAWLDAGWPRLHAIDLAAVTYVGIVTAGVAYLLFNHALRHVSAASGVTLALGEPVVAFVLATTVVGEPAGTGAVLGLLLVIAGVWVVVRVELTSTRNLTPAPA